jgi:hypothetical protein
MLRAGPRHALAPPRAALLKRPHLVRAGGLRPRRDARRLPHADSLAAIGVAGPIAVAGYRLVRATIDALVDRAPRGTDRRYAPRRPNAGSRVDGGDPASHQLRRDRRRAHRFGAPHAAAGTGGGDKGGACDAERQAIAAGGSDHHRPSHRARRRDDRRPHAADRNAPASAGA